MYFALSYAILSYRNSCCHVRHPCHTKHWQILRLVLWQRLHMGCRLHGSDAIFVAPGVDPLCRRVAEENATVRALAARGADALQQMAHQLAGGYSTP